MTLEYLGILMWNRALAAVLRTFCWPHLPKVLRAWHIFNILKCKSSFRYSPVHILPTSSSLKVLRTPSFFKTFWSANRALAPVLCAFYRRLSQIEPRNRGNRDPTSANIEATLLEETRGFAPESVFTREFTRGRTVTLPNYLMMDGWHDDVVDIMVGMLTMTTVHNSEVF